MAKAEAGTHAEDTRRKKAEEIRDVSG